MKRLLLVLALWALPSDPAHAFSDRDDAAAIVRVVVAREAAALLSWSHSSPTCVSGIVEESTFDNFRRAREDRARAELRTGPQRENVVSIDPFPWRGRPTDPDGPMIPPQPEERQALAEAVDAILARPEQPRLINRIDRNWLVVPFRLCRRTRNRTTLHLRSPVIHGDLAFVEVEFECALCGHGTDYALRRRGRNWEIVAVIERWVS